MSEDIFKQLNSDFPGRTKEIEELGEYFLNDERFKKPIYPHISLCGPPSTGKTEILVHFLKNMNYSYIFINCVQCRVEGTLYSQLLCGLFGEFIEDLSNFDSMESVSICFQKASDKRNLCCIVLKNSEELKKSEIQELCLFQETLMQKGWKFSLVFISQDDYHLLDLNRSLVTTFFPRYNEEQLLKILVNTYEGSDVNILRNFLNLFLPVVTPVFQDLCDLKRLVPKFYAIYKKPINEGTLPADDVSNLTRSILACLKIETSDMLYSFPQKSCHKMKNSMELPLASKYLLIAAFLCSFVPKSEDKKLFCTVASKIKKRTKPTSMNDLKLGPKSFSFPRLLAVYRAIMGEKTSLNLNLISQVASLVELKLIAPIGSARIGNIDEASFKCMATLDCVNTIAKNTGVDLGKFVVF